ncbi:VVA0879 family protein [Streptomyces albogriseolus]|uniref:VVA0879 family protein n=1 Tax=Streptomyces albogriseolus TaxID=1887 RepID=UPI00345FB3C7
MNGEPRVLTQDELWAEARERFGQAPQDWAFQCPSCGDIATGHDIRQALLHHPRKAEGLSRDAEYTEVLGQECIGRVLGKTAGRGCQYAAFGFIHGPWQVAIPYRTKPMYCFPLAPAPAGEQGAGQ